MSNPKVVELEGRGVLAVLGEDRVAFLQGLVSNDVERVALDRAVYSALLTPQGKFLLDFVMASDGDRLLLECEACRLADLSKKLRVYKLRSKVELADVSADFRSY
ncbi:MAG: folate-binding protein, partial [Alphaproteobacteria bacterium]|nr:folate-binding protein [Alphaproteobacteria bacterium]